MMGDGRAAASTPVAVAAGRALRADPWLQPVTPPLKILHILRAPLGGLFRHVLDVARECPFHQRLCVIGGGAEEVRATADLHGVDVVENLAYGEGCSSSIAAALRAVDPRADVLVLMLGDQPGVQASTVAKLIADAIDAVFEDTSVSEIFGGHNLA